MIYFIKDSITQAIKIGYSKHPTKRISGLQTGNPRKLILLGTIRGTEADEGAFHLRFAHYRLEGEWFTSDIIEDVLTIIAEHQQRRVELRRRTMTEAASNSDKMDAEPAPSGNQGTLDADSGIQGLCRIPGLRLKAFALKLTERPYEDLGASPGQVSPRKNWLYCGLELKYLLEFEKDITNGADGQQQELSKLHGAMLAAQQQKGLWHTFYDEDNAVIPFRPSPTDCHIVGGADAMTGIQGDAFRVVVACEKLLDPNHHHAKLKDVFMGENYTGEHPLRKAKKLVVSVR